MIKFSQYYFFKRFVYTFLCITIFTNISFSQNFSTPFISNYNAEIFNSSPQIWAVEISYNGIVYFGNESGIIEFDGKNWNKISIKNHSGVRCLKKSETGEIYTGAMNEFGYIKSDLNGKMIYTSLSDLLDEKNRNFGSITGIEISNNEVFFLSDEHLFKYSKNKIDIINPVNGLFFSLFSVKNKIYLQETNSGILEYKDKEFKILPNTEKYSGDAVYFIKEFSPDNLLIGYRGIGLMLYSINEKKFVINKEIQKTSEYLSNYELFQATKFPDGKTAISVINQGVFILEKNGEIKEHISEGLISNMITNMIVDNNSNLWVVTDRGISFIETGLPLRLFKYNHLLKENTYSIIDVDNLIYFGNNFGVYSFDYKNNFTKVEGIDSRVNLLYNYSSIDNKTNHNILLAGTTNGLFEIKNNKATAIKNFSNVTAIYVSHDYPEIVFLGQRNTLTGLYFNKGKWKILGKVEEIVDEVQNILIDSLDIWISTKYNGIYKLELMPFAASSLFENITNIEQFNTFNNLPDNYNNKAYKFLNQLIFSTVDGFYMYDKKRKMFFNDTFLNNQLPNKNLKVSIISCDTVYKKYWFACEKGGITYRTNKSKNSWVNLPFTKIEKNYNNCIYPDKSGNTWISNSNGIYIYKSDADYKTQKTLNCFITKILLNSDSINFSGFYNKNETTEKYFIDYKLNNITFEFVSPSFEYSEFIEYSYKLSGNSDKWSEWSSDPKIYFSNLSEGNYNFQIKSRINQTNIESKIINLKFVVKPPFYRTILAYFIYLILFILFIIIILKLYTKRHIKEKEKLENIIDKRTGEILEQNILLEKKQLESNKQARILEDFLEELKSSQKLIEDKNAELSELSLIVSKTDNAVMLMSNIGEVLWVNDGFTKIYGYTLQEFTIKGTSIFICSTNEQASNYIRRVIKEKRTTSYEVELRHISGRYLWVQTTCTPIFDDNNELSKIIGIDADITQQKLAEEKIILQNKQITIQNKKIEKQNEEITAGIRYAEQIQHAILPTNKTLKKIFKTYFTFSRPKDIISGDFYWAYEKNNIAYVAVSDCTGHGVPASLLSMIGIALLNEIIISPELIYPSDLLNELRRKIKITLKQKGKFGESKDGMDVALCSINYETLELNFSGAFNSIYIIRNFEVIELKGDRMPVGVYYSEEKSFTYKLYQLQKGDSIYLFSDGFADQFGGPNNKKFYYRNFKKLLVKISDLSMNEQKEFLGRVYADWLGSNQQIDDVLIFGVKI